MAEIEFLPLPGGARSSDESRPDRVESLPATPAPPPTSTGGEAQEPTRVSSPLIRVMTLEEISQHVAPDYAATGNPLPDPSVSTFLGLFASDGQVSYLCLQVKLHAQPLVLRPGHEHYLRTLVAAAERHILSTAGPQWVYLFTPAGKLAQLASTMGMQLEPWVVMSKLVAPEAPAKPAFEIIQTPISDPGPFPETEDYQSRPADDAWETLFPNGVLDVERRLQ